MKEENRKEILTREIIKKELKEVYIHNLLRRCWYIPAFVLYAFAVSWLISYHLSLKDGYANTGVVLLVIQYGFVIIVSAALLLFVGYNIYKFVSIIVLICKDKFDISVDKLVDKQVDGQHKYSIVEYSIDEMELHDHRKPYVFLLPSIEIHTLKRGFIVNKLRFAKHKIYYLPEGKLYRWSDKYRMEHWAVYRWAEMGDDFYLVTIKNKVLYAYNSRHFELKE